jgi:hypothetical protein
MIKSYLEFINESQNPPGEGTENTTSISLTTDEINLIGSEPVLSNMISNQEITLMGNQLYYYNSDKTTQNLNRYFPDKIVNSLEEKDEEVGHISNENKKS